MSPSASPSATLARRFQQNWLAKYPSDNCPTGGNLDDSLTSLSWLQNLKVSEITQPRQGSSPGITGLDNNNNNNFSNIARGRNGIKQEPPSSPPSPLLPLHQQSGMVSKYDPRLGTGMLTGDIAPSMMGPGGQFNANVMGTEPVDYKTNPYVKPPYSYASLICMAMKATRKNKITLSSIYNWITDNFMYYRLTDPSWQNSIRHNLSLNKCFEKVARRKDEPGKGGFWRINPDFCDMAENGIFKKRRGSRDTRDNLIPSPPLKRFKLEDDDDDDDSLDFTGSRRRLPLAAGMKSSTREDKLLSNGSLGADLSMDDDDDDDNSLSLRPIGSGNGRLSNGDNDLVIGAGLDFNWTSILSQDIDIGGKTVKTEAILDDPDLQQPSPFMAMSPPSSETNSDDLGLDDLFSQTDLAMTLPVDFQTNDPLDLTVHGTTIKPPQWWNADPAAPHSSNVGDDNFHADIFNNNTSRRHNSRLNTPVPPSPQSDHDAMWGEGLALSSSGHHFDLDNLFEFDNIPSPQL